MEGKKRRFIKIHIGFKTRLFFAGLIFLVFLFLGIFFFLKILSSSTTHQLFYNESSNLDYKVCLKENEYFIEKCLDKDLQYIANIIDYVTAEFKYSFSASNIINCKYNYYISAKIIATEKGNPNKTLYKKEDILLQNREYNLSNSNAFSINEVLQIDYALYNEMMKAFRKDYTLTLDSNLVITLHLSLIGEDEKIDENININQAITLSIPLSEQTLNITPDYVDINESKIISDEKPNNSYVLLLYIVSGVSSILAILSAYKMVKLILRTTKKSDYQKTLNRILREYNQIIVETKSAFIVDKKKVIELNSFEELLDARLAIGKPILYTKIHNEKSIFMIASSDEIYRYILKSTNLGKK